MVILNGPCVRVGLDIVANRLFGPQPRTSTYVCIWKINVGDIRGMLSVQEVKILQAVFDAFGINYSDVINSPAAEYAVPVDPDGERLRCPRATSRSRTGRRQSRS